MFEDRKENSSESNFPAKLDITRAIQQNAVVIAIEDETREYILLRLAENDKKTFQRALKIARDPGKGALSLSNYVQYSDNIANCHKVFWLLKIYALTIDYLNCDALDIENREELWEKLHREIDNADTDLASNYLKYLGRSLILNDTVPPVKYVETLAALSMQVGIDIKDQKYKDKFNREHIKEAQALIQNTEKKVELANEAFTRSALSNESLTDEQIFELACHVDPSRNIFEQIKKRAESSSKLSQALPILNILQNYKNAIQEYNQIKSSESIKSIIACVKELAHITAESQTDEEMLKFYKIAFKVNNDFIQWRLSQFLTTLQVADKKLTESKQDGISTDEAQALVDRVTISSSTNIGTRAMAYGVKASAISRDTSIQIGTTLLHAILVVDPALAKKTIDQLIKIQNKNTTLDFFNALPSREARLAFVKLLFKHDYSFLKQNKGIEQTDINQYIDSIARYSPEKTFALFDTYKNSDPDKSEALALAILNNWEMREWLFSNESNKSKYQSLICAINKQLGDEKASPQSNITTVFSEWTKTDFDTAINFSATEEDKQLIRWAMLTNAAAVSDMKMEKDRYFKELDWDRLTIKHIQLIPKEVRLEYLKYLGNFDLEYPNDSHDYTWNKLKKILGKRNNGFDLTIFRERAKAFSADFNTKEIIDDQSPFVLQLLSLNNPDAVGEIIKNVLKDPETSESRMQAWAIMYQMDNGEGLLDEKERDQLKITLDNPGNLGSQLVSYFTDSQAPYKYQLMLTGFCHYEEADPYRPSLTPFVKAAFLENPDPFCRYSTVAAIKIISEDPDCATILNANGYQNNKLIRALRKHYTKENLLEDQKTDIGKMLGETTFSDPVMLEQFIKDHKDHEPSDSIPKRLLEGLLWGALLGVLTYAGAKLIGSLMPNVSSILTNILASSSTMTTMATPILSGVAMTASILTGAGIAAALAYALAPVLVAAAIGAIAVVTYNLLKKDNIIQSSIDAVKDWASGVPKDELDYVTLVNGIKYWDVNPGKMHEFLNNKTNSDNLAKNILYHKSRGNDISKENISPETQNIMKLLSDKCYYEKKPYWSALVNAIYVIPYGVLTIFTLGNASKFLSPPWSLDKKLESAIQRDIKKRGQTKMPEASQDRKVDQVEGRSPQELLSKRKRSKHGPDIQREEKSSSPSPTLRPVEPSIRPLSRSSSNSSLTNPPASFAALPSHKTAAAQSSTHHSRRKKTKK